jgi:hypothetical protein
MVFVHDVAHASALSSREQRASRAKHNPPSLCFWVVQSERGCPSQHRWSNGKRVQISVSVKPPITMATAANRSRWRRCLFVVCVRSPRVPAPSLGLLRREDEVVWHLRLKRECKEKVRLVSTQDEVVWHLRLKRECKEKVRLVSTQDEVVWHLRFKRECKEKVRLVSTQDEVVWHLQFKRECKEKVRS